MSLFNFACLKNQYLYSHTVGLSWYLDSGLLTPRWYNSEGLLQKWLPDKISGAIFEVLFAILARRVGCTTKPF